LREELLHFIWKYKKLQLEDLSTSAGESVRIIDIGLHNHLSGPDFFNSKVEINKQIWAGNVEIHLKSSDWYRHNHEQDPNYNNVILHVVWEDDGEVFHEDSSSIPTLELKNYISKNLLNAYQKLFDQKGKHFLNCENEIAGVETFLFENWKERLFFERLEDKTDFIAELLEASQNNWEQVLFTMLLKNFGLKINGPAFLSLANALDYSVILKLRSEPFQLESVLIGMSHMLEDSSIVDDYYIKLRREYDYQKKKFNLKDEAVEKPEFFKLRPPNFPTIRLSQLANLYCKHQNLFGALIDASGPEQLYELLDVAASDYWNDHFTFGKSSKKSQKKLTKKFIDLLIINTILPLKLCHAKQVGKDVHEEILKIASHIKSEENSIISNFKSLGVKVKNTMDSQSILQLYNAYCTKNRCLQCAVGNNLLSVNG